MSKEKKSKTNGEEPANAPSPDGSRDGSKDLAKPRSDFASGAAPVADSTPTEKKTNDDVKKNKAKKPHRWRRRVKITVWTIVLLFCIFRIAVSLALPAALNKVAGYYNLDCTYDRCSLSFLGGNVAIWHLRFLPKNHGKTSGSPLLTTEYVQGTIDPIKLLSGKLYVWRAEVDGADLSIERTRDGRIPILESILAARSQSTPASKTPTSQLDLEPPFKLEALRVEHLTAHLRDLRVTPTLDTTLNLGVRISDVGSASRPMRFDVHLAVDGLLDSMDISGQRTGNTRNLDASLAILIQGLKLKPAAGYLHPFGIRPVATNMTVRMNGHLQVAASTQPTTTPWVSAALALSDLSVSADGKEAVGCDEIRIPVPYADATSAKLGKITIAGLRVAAERLHDGTLRFAGVDLVPVAAEASRAPATLPSGSTANGPAIIASAATQPAIPLRVTADGFRLLDSKLSFEDQSVSPVSNFLLLIDEISSTQLKFDPNDPNSALDLTGVFEFPGLVRQVRLSGKLRPFAATKTVDVSLKASGIRPDLLTPYLNAIGIESLYNDGEFECAAACDAAPGKSGGMTLNARLFDVKLSDTRQLLALDQVKLSGLTLSPSNLIGIDSLEIDGPELGARRDADGTWSSLGFRVKGATALPSAASAASSGTPGETASAQALASVPPAPLELPRVEIGKFTWKNVRLNVEDDTFHPPIHLVLNDAGIEVSHFLLDLNSKHPAQPGHVKLWLAAENVARKVTLDGTLTPQPNAMSIDLNLDGEGLSGSLLAPYLSSLGIVPTLRDGKIVATLRGKIAKAAGGGINSSMVIEKLHYTDGATELASIDSLHLDDVDIDGSNLTIGGIDMGRPVFRAARHADGSLEIGGIRLHGATPVAQQSAEMTPAVLAHATGAREAPRSATLDNRGRVVVLKKLHVYDAQLIWADHAVSPAVQTSLTTSVDLDNFVLGRRAQPSPLNVSMHVPGSLEELRISGNVMAAPDDQAATLMIAADGIKSGALAAYLPPGMRLNVADGRLRLAINASVGANPAGGRTAKLSVDQFTWQEGTSSPLVSFDRFTLNASRVDPAGKIIAIDELSLSGLQAELKLLPDGAADLLGLTINPSPTAIPAAPRPAAAPLAAAAPPAGGSAAPVSAEQIVAETHKVLPLFTLQKLDLQVRSISVLDARRNGASRLSINNLEFRNVEPIKWLGPDAINLPPTKFVLFARIDPLIDKLDVETTIAPFARQPSLSVDFAASGIHGDGVTKLMPELSSQIDGREMRDGRFAGHLAAILTVQRRGSAQFDLSKGFDLDLSLKGTEMRASPSGPVLLGLDEVRAEGLRYRPQTGIRLKLLEVTKPIGSALIDHDGLHIAGMVVKAPGVGATPAARLRPALAANGAKPVSAASSATRATDQPANAAAPAAIQPATTQPSPEPLAVKPAHEFRIDRVLISGLDLRLEDRSVEPAMIVPLTGLDVDVRGLSNWLPYEDSPLRFTVLVNSGKVMLPKKQEGSGIPGVIGDVASIMGGKKTESKPEFEQRELFSELTATGNLRLFPYLSGYIKASADGLELAEFAGEAKARANVIIGGGTFDSTTDVRFPGDGSTNLHVTLAMTDLLLSEPPNGPLQRLLKLVMPIDIALKALETPDGAITVPVNVTEKEGKLSGIGSSVVNAIGGVLIKAIASAPVKAAQGVVGLVGINLKLGKHVAPPPATFSFSAGDAGLEAADATALTGVIDAMRRDKLLVITIRHDLGGGDIPILASRSNPSPEEAAALAYQLHVHEQDLLHLRADVAGQTRALLSSGGDEAAAATAIYRLRDIDRDLSQTDNALDHVYDLLRPGANLQAARHTRAAGIEIGNQRLLSIESALRSAGIANLDQRVHLLAAQFNPSEDKNGGKVTIIFTVQKK